MPSGATKMSMPFPRIFWKKTNFFSWLWKVISLVSLVLQKCNTPRWNENFVIYPTNINYQLNFCSLKISTQNGPLKKIGNKKNPKKFFKVRKKVNFFSQNCKNRFHICIATEGIFYRRKSQRPLKYRGCSQLSNKVH